MKGLVCNRPTGFSTVQKCGLQYLMILNARFTKESAKSKSRGYPVLALEYSLHGGLACTHTMSVGWSLSGRKSPISCL